MPGLVHYFRNSWMTLALTALAVLVIGCSGGDDDAETAVGEASGESAPAVKAPDFSLPDLQGNTVELSDFEDRVLLVDFWATWCVPCRLEVPHLVELHNSYKDRGFEILGIALDENGEELVEAFVREHNVTYPVVIGNRDVAIAFGGLTAIPTAFMIDQDGRIVNKYVGYTEKAVFEEEIKRLLD